MKNWFRLDLRFGVLTFLCLVAAAHAFDYGDLDANRFPIDGWQNLAWADPGNWQTVNVTNSGAIPAAQRIPANDPTVDASARLKWIVDNVNVGQNLRLYFPTGTYHFQTDCLIERGNLDIQGDGPTATVFRLDIPAAQSGGLRFAGAGAAAPTDVTGGAGRNSGAITVADAAGFAVGDFVEIFMSNSGLKDNYAAGQISRITAKNGNTLTLDLKLGVDMIGKSPKAQKRTMLSNVRVRDLKLFRVRDNVDVSSNIKTFSVHNFNVKNVTSERSANHHMEFGRSRDVIVRACVFEDALDQGVGGHGYGVAIKGNTTQAMVVDSHFENLRHDVVIHFGGNHSVIAYNAGIEGPQSGTDNRFITHGRGAHNNLFEGNFSDRDIVSDNVHGAELRGNTYFRNWGRDVGDENPAQDTMNVVANEVEGALRNNGAGSNYVGANEVGGVFQNGVLSPTSVLPESLFLTAQPPYVSAWPLYGPVGGTGGGGTTVYRLEVSAGTYNGDAAEAVDGEGGNVRMKTWNNAANQRWLLVDLGGGLFRLNSDSATYNGKALQAFDSAGGDVKMGTWQNWGNQKWKLIDLGGGLFRIESAASTYNGKVLQAMDGDNGNLKMNTWQNWGNQKWRLVILP